MLEKLFFGKNIVKIGFLAALVLGFFAPADAQRVMNDRELDGLKGSVLTLIVEEADISIKDGKELQSPRRIKEAKEYTPSGNFVKTYDSMSGKVNVYTSVDDAPAFRELTVAEAEAEEKKANKNPSKNRRRADSKNANVYKWRYKYGEQGRIVERRLLSASGDELIRFAYQYDANGRLFRITDSVKSSARFVETYERDTNGVQTASLFDGGGVGNPKDFVKSTYTDYEFDPKGNWIKRTETAAYPNDAETTTEKKVFYRKISYYKD